MSFLTPMLLAGTALVAVPVVLHLVMKRQARQLYFPALRFVQQRRESNRRRMRLRHWLLLALRCLLIGGAAIALARPALQGSGLRGKEGAPLAVSVVIDNSLRTQYVHQNRSRLEYAAEAAQELVAKLPEDSMVAICDLGRAAHGFAPDLSAAASRLRNLRAAAAARPLASVVVEAIELAAEQTDRRQEVFVFTDLTAAAWPEDATAAIAAALEESPDVRVYIFDAGVAEPKNASLGELQLRRTVLRPGESFQIDAPVTSNLGGESPLVELLLTGEDGRLEKRGQYIVDFDEAGQGRAPFTVGDLPLGTHQGAVRLTAADPLAVDNTRYFTVEVRPPARVLLLGRQLRDVRFVREALCPSAGGLTTRFDCRAATFDQAAGQPLDDCQAVLLLDPDGLTDEWWSALDEYVSRGGGVGIMLGHNADFRALNEDGPQRLLPGKLLRISREETYLRPRSLNHPSLAALRDYSEDIPWPLCKVFRYWQFDTLAGSVQVVADFADGDPAILERAGGDRGRVVTVATPFSDPLNPEGREPWNVLTSFSAAWPFVALCDELTGYLARDAEVRLEYYAGETARVELDSDERVTSYVLRMPSGQAINRVATGGDELTVSVTDELGNYRLTAGGRSQQLDRGFSVNAPPEMSNLARIDPAEIVNALPEDRVRLADDLQVVEEYVNVGRSGRELYPWAIALVAIVWGAEHVLANRFYRRTAKG